jgi:hypothetical protein
MAFTDLIKATAQAEDANAATALAAMLNADQTFRACAGGSREFTAADVIRLGKNVLSYNTIGLPKAGSLDTAIRERGVSAIADGLGQTNDAGH